MADAPQDGLHVTPLNALHRELGAKMVPFAGYDMPVQYPAGILAEHNHARAAAGLFDVSHMGQVRLEGAGAAAALETLVPADIVNLATGRTRYTQFTSEDGGILDDLMVTNRGDHLFLVVNVACKAQDLAHMRARLGGDRDLQVDGHEAPVALAVDDDVGDAHMRRDVREVAARALAEDRRLACIGEDEALRADRGRVDGVPGAARQQERRGGGREEDARAHSFVWAPSQSGLFAVALQPQNHTVLLSVASKTRGESPVPACEPSQKGCFFERPQEHQ